MAAHIQPAGLADEGIAGETVAPPDPPPAQVRLRRRDRRCSRSSRS